MCWVSFSSEDVIIQRVILEDLRFLSFLQKVDYLALNSPNLTPKNRPAESNS